MSVSVASAPASVPASVSSASATFSYLEAVAMAADFAVSSFLSIFCFLLFSWPSLGLLRVLCPEVFFVPLSNVSLLYGLDFRTSYG